MYLLQTPTILCAKGFCFIANLSHNANKFHLKVFIQFDKYGEKINSVLKLMPNYFSGITSSVSSQEMSGFLGMKKSPQTLRSMTMILLFAG